MRNQSRIQMLDCTLRDGGCVNDFQFGKKTMNAVLAALENAGLRLIELGYLDAKKGSPEERTEYCDSEAIHRNRLLEKKHPETSYLAMIDYGKYPVEKLPPRSADGLDGIRLCFHKEDKNAALEMGQQILQKGYQLLLQPMVCTRYTDEEFVLLLEEIQEKLEKVCAVYLVDSFGAMSVEAVTDRLLLADRVLKKEIRLGLHMHNNQQLSFPAAKAAVKALEDMRDRGLLIDGTLAGIGKGAGNLRTEEFAEYLNRYQEEKPERGQTGAEDSRREIYDAEKLKAAAETLIEPLRSVYRWGYCEEYYLSAKYCLSPSYAKLFAAKGNITMEEVEALLLQIPDEKKDSFDRLFAETLLEQTGR